MNYHAVCARYARNIPQLLSNDAINRSSRNRKADHSEFVNNQSYKSDAVLSTARRRCDVFQSGVAQALSSGDGPRPEPAPEQST